MLTKLSELLDFDASGESIEKLLQSLTSTIENHCRVSEGYQVSKELSFQGAHCEKEKVRKFNRRYELDCCFDLAGEIEDC